jgi:hypothetical protein
MSHFFPQSLSLMRACSVNPDVSVQEQKVFLNQGGGQQSQLDSSSFLV